MIVPERTLLGIKIGNTTIPDPSEFKYTAASLDASAERNTNGELQRDMVATKHNIGLKWDALSWATIKTVLGPCFSPGSREERKQTCRRRKSQSEKRAGRAQGSERDEKTPGPSGALGRGSLRPSCTSPARHLQARMLPLMNSPLGG